jgi:hypothetical protein
MKHFKRHKYFSFLLVVTLFIVSSGVVAQDEKPAEEPAPEKLVRLRYFNQDNSMQYVVVESVLKTGKKSEPRANVSIQVYLDSIANDRLVTSANTGGAGKIKAIVPPSLKEVWDAGSKHSFIVVEAPESKGGEGTTTSFEMEKAKLTLDTTYEEGVRHITIQVMRLENREWVPANEVEMKIGVERLGGVLVTGGEETYTTDSNGVATAEFTRTGIPGNENGNIVLVARVDDHELFGNLQIKKTVPWGVVTRARTDFFDQRTLWSTRQKAPVWLMFLAYSIIASVWGVLIFLVIQLFKIKKLGKVTAS